MEYTELELKAVGAAQSVSAEFREKCTILQNLLEERETIEKKISNARLNLSECNKSISMAALLLEEAANACTDSEKEDAIRDLCAKMDKYAHADVLNSQNENIQFIGIEDSIDSYIDEFFYNIEDIERNRYIE